MKAINQTFLHPCEFPDMAGKSMESDNDYENNADINELLAIATLCPYTEGEGVFVARALLAQIYPDSAFVSLCEEGFTADNKSLNSETDKPYKTNLVYTLYPNPVNDVLFLISDIKEDIDDVTIEIYDLSGMLVFETQYNIYSTKGIDVSKLSDGFYLLSITTMNGDKYHKKFVKTGK